MDRALQAKLLKVIEDGRVRRLGAVQERQVNVRIVAATNQDLEDHIRQGLFRADLYFRLRVLQINVPPLRERVGDPLQLARHFLAEFGQRYRKSGLSFTPAAEAAPTPGRAMCGSCATWWSRPCCLSPAPASGRPTCCCRAAPRPARPGRRRPAWRPRRSCAVRPWSGVEREMLAQALALTGGNVSRAARELGISRDTLRYRMEKYGIGATFTGP